MSSKYPAPDPNDSTDHQAPQSRASSTDSRRLAARDEPMCRPADAHGADAERVPPSEDSRITASVADDGALVLECGQKNDRSRLISDTWVDVQSPPESIFPE